MLPYEQREKRTGASAVGMPRPRKTGPIGFEPEGAHGNWPRAEFMQTHAISPARLLAKATELNTKNASVQSWESHPASNTIYDEIESKDAETVIFTGAPYLSSSGITQADQILNLLSKFQCCYPFQLLRSPLCASLF